MPWRKWAQKMADEGVDAPETEEEGKRVAEQLRLLAGAIEKSASHEILVDWPSVERLASGILKVALDVQKRQFDKRMGV